MTQIDSKNRLCPSVPSKNFFKKTRNYSAEFLSIAFKVGNFFQVAKQMRQTFLFAGANDRVVRTPKVRQRKGVASRFDATASA